MSFGFTTKVEIIRPHVTVDRYKNETVDYDNADTVDVPELVSLQPASATDTGGAEDRSSTIRGWRLITPAGVDLDLRLPHDRIAAGGMRLKVVGDVLRWPHPIIPGGVHHVEAQLELVTG